MRHYINYGLLGVIVLMLSSCASFTKTVDTNIQSNPDKAYVYGRLFQIDHVPMSRLLVGAVIRNAANSEKYQIRFEEKNQISVIEIPEGTYVFEEILCATGDRISVGQIQIQASNFKAIKGTAYYIGDMEAETGAGFNVVYTTTKWKLNSLKNNFEKSTEEFHSAFPGLASLPTVSVFNQENFKQE